MQVDGISGASESARHYSLNNNKNEKEEQYEPLFDYETDAKIIKAGNDILSFCKDTFEQMELNKEKENSIKETSTTSEKTEKEETSLFGALFDMVLDSMFGKNEKEEEKKESTFQDKFAAAAFEVLLNKVFSNAA